MKRLKIFLACLVLFVACGKDGKDGEGCGWNGCGDGALPITVVSNPNGKIETAFCKKGTVVWGMSVDSAWAQSYALPGQIKQNDGFYQIFGAFAGPYVSYLVPDGTCYSETDDLYIDGVVLRMMQPGGATEHNINGATSIEFNIAEDHFFDISHADFGNVPAAFLTARSEIYTFWGFPGGSAPFYNFSVTGDTTADAYLFALEATIANGRSGPERNDFTVQISNAILENDLPFRAALRQDMADLPIKKVVDNLEAEQARQDVTVDTAPIWVLPFYPDYYADLMVRTPTVLDSKNIGYTATGVIDVADYDKFAHPIQLATSNPKYIALNLENAKSIWTVKTHVNGYLCPDSKVADLVAMNEVLLEDPFKSGYNYEITGSLSAGQYFVYQEFDELSEPSKLQEGDLQPFGYSIASTDGVNWIPFGGIHPGIRNRSIKYYTTD